MRRTHDGALATTMTITSCRTRPILSVLRRTLQLYVLPKYGDRDFTTISLDDKYKMIVEAKKVGGNGPALAVASVLAAMKNFAIDREMIRTATAVA